MARVAPVLEPILADHAREYWQRGWRRAVLPEAVVWTIDGVPIVVLELTDDGPDRLVVHDFSVVDSIRRAIRTRHVDVRWATARDAVPVLR